MAFDRLLDLAPALTLACLLSLSAVRMALLSARGVRVVVVDPQRTAAEVWGDLVGFIVILLWIAAVAAAAWPQADPSDPRWLGAPLYRAAGVRAAGVPLLAASIGLYWLALAALGRSWRMGIDRKRPGPLVTEGVFAWSRNPIYVSFDLFAAASLLVHGRLAFVLLALATVGGLHLQMIREEQFLLRQYGNAYRGYRARVGRYLTAPERAAPRPEPR